jgi:hypothetical protein
MTAKILRFGSATDQPIAMTECLCELTMSCLELVRLAAIFIDTLNQTIEVSDMAHLGDRKINRITKRYRNKVLNTGHGKGLKMDTTSERKHETKHPVTYIGTKH